MGCLKVEGGRVTQNQAVTEKNVFLEMSTTFPHGYQKTQGRPEQKTIAYKANIMKTLFLWSI